MTPAAIQTAVNIQWIILTKTRATAKIDERQGNPGDSKQTIKQIDIIIFFNFFTSFDVSLSAFTSHFLTVTNKKRKNTVKRFCLTLISL